MRLEVIRRIAGKELKLFFASPIGYLFLLAFLAASYDRTGGTYLGATLSVKNFRYVRKKP